MTTLESPSPPSPPLDRFTLDVPRPRPTGTQVWAPLIEKAFAKLHGCYESLGRGSIEQGLRCLTGTPVIRTPLTGLEPKRDSDGGFVNKESERRRQDLWTKMKKWVLAATGRVVG